MAELASVSASGLRVTSVFHDGSSLEVEESQKVSETPTSDSPRSFAIYWHPACADHEIPRHPEQPDRVKDMMDALKAENWPGDKDVFRLAPKCTPEDILLYHTKSHLLGFETKCKRVEEMKEKKGKNTMLGFDSDTTVMWGTREAAYRACGAMIAAVDAVYMPQPSVETAFCCTRPPGHHAERNVAQGFCFLNNAAIGALYAQKKYGDSHGIRKVAVMDFDVHHGNGTEEGFAPNNTLFYGSTHEKDNYPGTGKDPSPHVGARAKRDIDRRIVNRYLIGGDGDFESPNKSSRSDFRVKWREVVEEMAVFSPDLVIFSAGFDAHSSDPLGNCWLEDEDFYWATECVLDVMESLDLADNAADAEVRGKRRAVSILEGGYDLEAISSSAVQHVRALTRLPCTAVTPEDAAPLTEEALLASKSSKERKEEKESKRQERKERARGDETAALAESLADMGLS